jgi:Fe-S-cluster-containing dehydrogenase component
MIGELFVDANRCIGCRACVQAFSECPEHDGQSMIHLDWLERATSVQTAPTVCMPEDGSQPSFTAKTSTSINASQKPGIE